MSVRVRNFRCIAEKLKFCSFSVLSHGGWRPWNALGFPRALTAWSRICDESLCRWQRGVCHTPTFYFAGQGLSTKVLLHHWIGVVFTGRFFEDVCGGANHTFCRRCHTNDIYLARTQSQILHFTESVKDIETSHCVLAEFWHFLLSQYCI